MDKLRAFYYPYSVISSATLKASALYFDEIFVQADPQLEGKDLEALYNDPTINEISAQKPEIYEDPNAVDIFDKSVPSGWALMVGQYGLQKFLEKTRVLQDEGILIIEERARAPHVDHKAFESAAKRLLKGVRGEEFIRIAVRVLAYGWITSLFIDPHILQPLNHRSVRQLVREVLALQFTFVFANSEHHSAVPIADNPKMKEQMDIFIAETIRRTDPQAATYPAIHGFSALQSRLPSLALHSYQDVLEARYQLKDELLEFRETVQELTIFIRSQGLGGSAAKEAQSIQKLINRKVDAIERKVARAHHKFFRQLAAGIALASPPALVSTLYPNMPIAALAAALTITAAGNIVNAWAEYRDSQEELNDEPHGISYLLKLKDVI